MNKKWLTRLSLIATVTLLQLMALAAATSPFRKISDAEWQWDRKKLTFYFTAEKRVDFRNLVRELAAMFRTRIELKQIGVRDEAKRLDGIGRCGHVFQRGIHENADHLDAALQCCCDLRRGGRVAPPRRGCARTGLAGRLSV